MLRSLGVVAQRQSLLAAPLTLGGVRCNSQNHSTKTRKTNLKANKRSRRPEVPANAFTLYEKMSMKRFRELPTNTMLTAFSFPGADQQQQQQQ